MNPVRQHVKRYNGVKCPMCGHRFNEEKAAAACKGCVIPKMYGGCKLVKCPSCGYEMPSEPKWLKRFLRHPIKSKEEDV